jgi:hypothetical protein
VRIGLIDALGASVPTDHRLEKTRAEYPLVQLMPAPAERVLQTLLRSGAKAVERDRKARRLFRAPARSSPLPGVPEGGSFLEGDLAVMLGVERAPGADLETTPMSRRWRELANRSPRSFELVVSAQELTGAGCAGLLLDNSCALA